MAAKFLPKSAAKAIYTHYDLLSSACINNSGVISITEDKKTLEELSAQKILSVLDENLEYRMNSKVLMISKKLLKNTTASIIREICVHVTALFQKSVITSGICSIFFRKSLNPFITL